MCTLTWRAVREGGYDLFFNRDELNTRGEELPPRRETRDGVNLAAPRDSDRGGTWLMVNAHGLTVALLNDYAVQWRPPVGSAVSRGALGLACASAATVAAAVRVIEAAELARTGAFTIIVLGADGGGRRLHWDGVILTDVAVGDGSGFETSSSFETQVVCASRRGEFEALLAGRAQAEGDELAAFHGRHDPANGAASVLMRRSDARTRSVTRVSVRADRVIMDYRPVAVGGENDGAVATGGGVKVDFLRL